MAEKAAYQDSVAAPLGCEHDDEATLIDNDEGNDLPPLLTPSDSESESESKPLSDISFSLYKVDDSDGVTRQRLVA